MGTIQAYSSVSVVDMTDVGSINLYCTSNQPTSVIYDPNQNVYIPNWSTSNLVITPVVSYAGSNIPLTSNELTITFSRKEGSGQPTTLTSGESVTNGVLTVSANKLASIQSGLLTYICSIVYTDSNTNVPIATETAMSFSLISRSLDLQYAGILGESVFLYDTNRAIVGNSRITLTADLTNVSISQWQYKQTDGTFAPYPVTAGINASNTGTTLIVDESEQGIWFNGRSAVIKLTTSENNVFDYHEIVKIYDGTTGSSSISAVLSNENHYLPCTSSGTVKSWNGSSTDIRIYEGGSDVTDSWTITVANGTGLTGTYDSSTHIYTPSALTGDSSYADFTCTRRGYSNIIKRYTITKQTAGADGNDAVIYEVVPDFYTMNVTTNYVFVPSSVSFNAYQKVGDSITKSNYSGRFIISESTDNGTTYTTTYTSGSDEYQKVYAPSSTNVDIIKCVLYESGATTNQLDDQSVVITRDGIKGDDGDDGADGLSVGLTNYSDLIPCNNGGTVLAARDLSIPFYAYTGITRTPVTATVGTLPTGITVKTNNAGTDLVNGLLVLAVAAGTNFGNIMSGDITITLSAESRTFDTKYSWSQGRPGADGENGMILQLYSEDGGTVSVGKNTTIKTSLVSGTSTVTPSAVQWLEFKNGTYQTISGQTGTSITITPAMVTDQMWLKCIATYGGKNFEAYYTIDDTTDPYISYTFSTIAEFKNNQGFGAVYTRVYQNGIEVDPIKSTVFSDTAPENPSENDFYYHLNQTNKTCVLKKYNGSEWIDATETDGFAYKYYRMDSQGRALDPVSPYKTTRCFYVDPTIINGRMQFFCEISDD